MKISPKYQAQCFGNIEPIEYMVPYPSLRSLAVGQCIKFSESILYKDNGMTNGEFLKSINRTANWLIKKGIKNDDRILVTNITTPMMDVLNYALWSLGATLVISNNNEIDAAFEKTKSKTILSSLSVDEISEINSQSDVFDVSYNSQLGDEAVIYYYEGKGIILDQYNLLINTYGVLKHLKILSKDILNIDLPQNTTASIVLKTILPLYAGASVSDKNNTITMSTNDDADYQIKFDWKSLVDTKPQSLYILPEATAVLAIGKTSNHLTSISYKNGKYKINGHSVMAGYIDAENNNNSFQSNSLIIQR